MELKKAPSPMSIKRANSKETIRMFSYGKPAGQVIPDFDEATVLALIDSDPIARGAINHFVAKCMEGDFVIIDRDTYEIDWSESRAFMENYNFRTNFLSKTFLFGKIFNNSLGEIVKVSNGHTKELNVIDISGVTISTKPNGDLSYVEGKIPDPRTNKLPRWEESEIVWFKFGDRSQGYAPTDIKSLYETLLIKRYIRQYVAWLWKTGQYRVLYSFENAKASDIEDFIAYNQKHDSNFQAPFLLKGTINQKIIRDMKENDSIVNFIKKLDSDTLVALQMQPIEVGIPDASGRASADSQNTALTTSINQYKIFVEDYINYDLFPKINKQNKLFLFKPNDRFEEKGIFENIRIMKSVGMSDDAVAEYLKSKRIFFKTKEIFVPQPIETPTGQKKDIEMMPSRERVSDETETPTRKDEETKPTQLLKRTEENNRWYIEPSDE